MAAWLRVALHPLDRLPLHRRLPWRFLLLARYKRNLDLDPPEVGGSLRSRVPRRCPARTVRGLCRVAAVFCPFLPPPASELPRERPVRTDSESVDRWFIQDGG